MKNPTPEKEQQIADELLNTELNLNVPDGWCHKCGRADKLSEANHGHN